MRAATEGRWPGRSTADRADEAVAVAGAGTVAAGGCWQRNRRRTPEPQKLSRMAKKSKRVKNMRFSMMDGGDEMDNKWARLLAYVTGLVNQELLLQNEYLTAENRILKAHLQAGFRLTDDERTTRAEIGKRLGRKALQKVVGIAK